MHCGRSWECPLPSGHGGSAVLLVALPRESPPLGPYLLPVT